MDSGTGKADRPTTGRPAKYGFHVYVTHTEADDGMSCQNSFFLSFVKTECWWLVVTKTLLLLLLVVLSSRVPRYYNLDLQYVVRT